MRTCYKCKASKADCDFHAGRRERMCKTCRSEYDKARKDRSAYNPKHNTTDAAKNRKRKWAAANRNPFKESARLTVRRAIESGRLVRPPICGECEKPAVRADGASAIQAHHTDYRAPLSVQWLCPKCHRKADAAMTKEASQ
jgi:rubredoxin